MRVFMCAQVINPGRSMAEPGTDEEANGTVRVDATLTETMPAPEQPHATPAEARSKVFDPLQDEPGNLGEVDISPEELQPAEAIRSETSETPEETCGTPTSSDVSQKESSGPPHGTNTD